MPVRFFLVRHLRLTALAPVLVVLLTLMMVAVATAQQPGSPPAGALEQIEIDVSIRGSRVFTPIAAPNTYNLGDTDPRGHQAWIGNTVRACLGMSGYFEVFGPDRYFFDPNREGMAPSTINFPNWHNVGAEALVKTAFRVATNQAALDFRLYNVSTGEQIDIGFPPITVPLNEVENETYRFVNLVIQYYTGNLGIFGSQIAFVARDRSGHKQIYTMTVGGEGMGAVTSDPTIHLVPQWVGGSLMYVSYRNGNPDLYLNGTAISSRPGLNVGGGARPGGGEIAASLSIDGQSEIYILSASGDIIRRCTDNPGEDVSPVWSPDGSQIAFVSDRSGGPQVFVMGSDCSGQRRLTFAGNYNTTPDWSPDGTLIAFTGRDSRNRFDVFTIDTSSGFITRLTQDQGNNEEPSWSPDGQYLVFQSTRGGQGSRLYVMTADGEHQTLLTPDGAGFEQPAWRR